ncbi:hypothetical protein O3P69_015900 [Scylla paramamosain]|uniref:Uncharacterized protein n=1 Tax=Scylla paramamosain TaxID=85552 RepID=A0AAW0T903_SCYPA
MRAMITTTQDHQGLLAGTRHPLVVETVVPLSHLSPPSKGQGGWNVMCVGKITPQLPPRGHSSFTVGTPFAGSVWGDNDSCNGMSKGKSSCTGDRGSGSGSGCDSISLSYKEQIQFAIFLSKQEAEAQGEAQVERRWQEVEEAADMMLAEALQVSEMYEASRLCAERQQAASAPGSHDLPEEEKESCAASGSGSAEDEDASVLLAYKLQQEEIAMMQRLCGNASNDWSKEMNCFFGPSLCGMGEDGNNFRGRDNATNGREQDSGEDGTTCCRGMEDEDNDDEGGAACHRRGDDGEDEVMCCGREEEEERGKKCSNSDEDDDLKKCCGDSCREEECDKRFLELMKSEEALLVEMALQLSLHYPQPSDSEDK